MSLIWFMEYTFSHISFFKASIKFFRVSIFISNILWKDVMQSLAKWFKMLQRTAVSLYSQRKRHFDLPKWVSHPRRLEPSATLLQEAKTSHCFTLFLSATDDNFYVYINASKKFLMELTYLTKTIILSFNQMDIL